MIGQSQSASDDSKFDWIEVAHLASCLLITIIARRCDVVSNLSLLATPRTSKFVITSAVWLSLLSGVC